MLPFQLPPCPNNDPTLQYLGRTRAPTISRQCARSFNGTNSEPFPPTKNRRLNNTRQCVLVNGQGSSLTVSFEIYQSVWGQEYPSLRDKRPFRTDLWLYLDEGRCDKKENNRTQNMGIQIQESFIGTRIVLRMNLMTMMTLMLTLMMTTLMLTAMKIDPTMGWGVEIERQRSRCGSNALSTVCACTWVLVWFSTNVCTYTNVHVKVKPYLYLCTCVPSVSTCTCSCTHCSSNCCTLSTVLKCVTA